MENAIIKLPQKEAVYKYTLEVLTDVKPGEKLIELLTKEVKHHIRQKLFDGFSQNLIVLRNPKEGKALKKYCAGVLANWIGKDERYYKVKEMV